MMKKNTNILKSNFKFTTFDIALMGIMMAIYIVVVYVLQQILPGKFNISIEILFYIIFGIIFGPLKGSIFSLLCDTAYQLFFGSIAFWMIEYAIVPPLVSLVSWFLMYFYEKETKFKFIFPLVILSLTIVGVIGFFIYQFIHESYKFDNSLVDPKLVFGLMITLCIIIFITIIVTLILYKIKKNYQYIKVLYLFAVVAIILIIFRWLWGPFAYINYFNRFLSSENNPNKVMSTQYPIVLSGIAMKTCFVLPIFVIILIPTLGSLNVLKKKYFANRNNQ